MKLSRTQFTILAFLENKINEKNLTQRGIARQTGLSIGTVNKSLVFFSENGLVEDNKITDLGIKTLEPYQVKRAVFIAAGFGARLVPITLNTPKPLVRVKGKRIIDTLLDAVTAIGIDEIIIVRGYLSEQFDQLKYKYPKIRFLENPLYNESNNISSMMCARYFLQNAYVFDSDIFLKNPNLITKYQYTSNYLGVPVERTDDWCLITRDGIITQMRVGGKNCHLMFGISYWNQADGARLADHIKQVYEMPGGKERYWDQVALEYFNKDYSIEVRECTYEDIIEIDTFNELKKFDETYMV
jgi:CTP:phosphocholine cytidylyltransferase-like protein